MPVSRSALIAACAVAVLGCTARSTTPLASTDGSSRLAAYCERVDVADRTSPAMEVAPAEHDPDSIQASYEYFLTTARDLARMAPAEIAEDLATQVHILEDLTDILDRFHYDVDRMAAVPDVRQRFDESLRTMSPLVQRVKSFNAANCAPTPLGP